jgi:hypothetical protein
MTAAPVQRPGRSFLGSILTEMQDGAAEGWRERHTERKEESDRETERDICTFSLIFPRSQKNLLNIRPGGGTETF